MALAPPPAGVCERRAERSHRTVGPPLCHLAHIALRYIRIVRRCNRRTGFVVPTLVGANFCPSARHEPAADPTASEPARRPQHRGPLPTTPSAQACFALASERAGVRRDARRRAAAFRGGRATGTIWPGSASEPSSGPPGRHGTGSGNDRERIRRIRQLSYHPHSLYLPVIRITKLVDASNHRLRNTRTSRRRVRRSTVPAADRAGRLS